MLNDLEKCSVSNNMNLNISADTLRSFTADMIFSLYEDIKRIEEKSKILENKYNYRVKSFGSVVMNMSRAANEYERLSNIWSDILALRIIVDEYPEVLVGGGIIQGKVKDEYGYRAYHVDYQLSPFHYPIEVQYWLYTDELFNTLSRKYLYKTPLNWVGAELRRVYDLGVIKSEADFMYYLMCYKEHDWNKELLWSRAIEMLKTTLP